MPRLPGLLAGLVALALSTSSPTIAAEPSPVLIYLTVPADATVAMNGVPIKQTGTQRRLITPPIAPGEKGTYTVTITVIRDGKAVSSDREIEVEGGKVTRADLTLAAGTPTPIEPKSSPKKIEPLETQKKADPPPKVEAPKKDDVKQPPKVDPPKPPVRLDVPYIATPQEVVDKMLELAGVKEEDVVFDLGCGDGRIVITAVQKFKAKRGVGVELAPERVKLSKENAEKAGVANQVEIREGDVLKVNDVSAASVVALYLLPDINAKLKPILLKTLKPGSRVVSHDFDMGEDWKPEKEVTVKDNKGREHTIYLWTIREKKVDPKRDPPAPIPAAKSDEPKPRVRLDVPYVPTPQSVVDEMLKLGGVKEGDVVYDLGCGDGRIVVTAVKDYKAKRGVGVDLDPERIKESRQNAKEKKVEDKVDFREGDVLKITDVSEASVVCLYLFPEINERLKPMLKRTLKPGSRVVSHDFLMGDDWKPEKEVSVKDASGQEHTLYLWTIREKK